MSTAEPGRSPDRATRRTRRVLAAVTAGVLLVALPTSAGAAWQASDSVSASLPTATVPVPTGVACATESTILTSSARVSWAAVSGATSYLVSLSDASGATSATASVTVPNILVTQGLLTGLLQGLIDLLLGGQPVYVSVRAVHSSGWMSSPSAAVPVRSSLVPVGVRCG